MRVPISQLRPCAVFFLAFKHSVQRAAPRPFAIPRDRKADEASLIAAEAKREARAARNRAVAGRTARQ